MKTGKSLVELAQEIERQRDSKKDFIANTAQLKAVALEPEPAPEPRPVTTRGTAHPPTPAPKPIALEIENQGRFKVGPVAHNQLSAWSGIPAKYYRRMEAEAPDLLATNLNAWFERNQQPRMVRTLDSRARAFLSNRYRVIDHEDVLEAVLPVLGDAGLSAREIVSAEVTERRLYIKALFPKVLGEIKRGDVVQAGVVISNSELGLGSVKTEALLYRLQCINGAIVASLLNKYHVGREWGTGADGPDEIYKDDTLKAIDDAFIRRLRDTVTAAASQAQFQKIIDSWKAATERTFNDPIGAVQVIQRNNQLTDDDRRGILKHLIEGADLSQFGLANAVTRYSQDVQDYDKATDLERLGGNVIDLSPKDWKVIAEAEAA